MESALGYSAVRPRALEINHQGFGKLRVLISVTVRVIMQVTRKFDVRGH